MAFRTYFVANGSSLSESSGLTYHSCHVNNRTGNWVFIPAANRYCNPGGYMAARVAPTRVATVFWQPPPGKTETVTRVTTDYAQVVFFSDDLPPGQPN